MKPSIYLSIFVASIFILIAPLRMQAQSDVMNESQQIEAAVSPVPDKMKDGAKVLGYNSDGKLQVLRQGNNQLICVADDPEQDNFHVACYHKDLEPFMERGRELKSQGLSREKVDSIRYKEIESGKITLPEKPMALYSLTGPQNGYDHTTGMIKKASPLYVVYVPYATEESTGLSKKPVSKGAPWIMEPGTPWAHIMVMTGRKIGGESE
ncbi:hypothetical protein [Fodinibius sp. Rm-B-1B1-1]|uniref:hypothetical protein n=1 Tax=Fodinibius alkaliphilus TaxID=3140241 RepID=UPI00315A0EDA